MIQINTLQQCISFLNGEYGRGDSSTYLDVQLTADIDFKDVFPLNRDTSNWYINFDGQGYSFKNLTLAGAGNQTLFGNNLYGSINNLNIIDIDIMSNSEAATFTINCYANISNCNISGYIIANNHAMGICHTLYNGKQINNCVIKANIISLNNEANGICIEGNGGNVFGEIKNTGVICNLIAHNHSATCFSNHIKVTDSYFYGITNSVVSGGQNWEGVRIFGYESICTRCYLVILNGSTGRLNGETTNYTNCCIDYTKAQDISFLTNISSSFPNMVLATTAQLQDITWIENSMQWSPDTWEIDSNNDNYPYIKNHIPSINKYFLTDIQGFANNKSAFSLVNGFANNYPAYSFYEEFNEFAKNENNYPLNRNIWKLDTQNDGYPWITGYLELAPKSTLPSLPYILSNGILSYMSGNIIDYDTLQPIFIYKKGENI